jgi:hypothetical protein
MLVTDAVLNSDTEVNAVQPVNILLMLVTDAILLLISTLLKVVQFANKASKLVTLPSSFILTRCSCKCLIALEKEDEIVKLVIVLLAIAKSNQ